MDAPLLVKIPDAKLKEMNYDALQIAEFELNSSVLPITVQRPTPRRKKDKIAAVKEDHVSDEDLIAKEKEVEQEIVEGAEELGFVNAGEEEVGEIETPSEEQ